MTFHNIHEALKILKPPLVFGNQSQIEATDFVGVYEDAAKCLTVEAYSRGPCTECDGDGTVECECDCGHVHDTTCLKCDGEGGAQVTRKWLDTLDREKLEDVIDELRKLEESE